MATRDRYYSTLRQCKSLGSINPIVEYLAECFAISAENVVKDSKKLVRQRLDRKPEARREKIMSFSSRKKEFGIQDVLALLEGIPRRTVERDLEILVSNKKLKAKGEKRARVYVRAGSK
jgi:predicted HTH transcriptional regulator